MLTRSPEDAGALCVSKTSKGIPFLKENAELGNKVHDAVFQDFTEEESMQYYLNFMVKGVLKALKKPVVKKEHKTAQEQFMADALGTSLDDSDRRYLTPL